MHESTCCGSIKELCWFSFYVLHNLVSFVQFKNVKNTHEGVLPLVKGWSLQLYELCEK